MAIIGGIFKGVCTNTECKAITEEKYFSILKNGKLKGRCPSCKKSSLIKLESNSLDVAPSIGGKHKKGRSEKEKKFRRETDFVKNVLPGLKGYDRVHFNKKYGKK